MDSENSLTVASFSFCGSCGNSGMTTSAVPKPVLAPFPLPGVDANRLIRVALALDAMDQTLLRMSSATTRSRSMNLALVNLIDIS